MAVVEIPITHEQPQHPARVELDGTEYRVRLTYRARLEAWYLDLYTADETPLALGRRLSPGGLPARVVVDGGPPGLLYVPGDDPYDRDALRLLYIEEESVPTASANDDLRVEVS